MTDRRQSRVLPAAALLLLGIGLTGAGSALAAGAAKEANSAAGAKPAAGSSSTLHVAQPKPPPAQSKPSSTQPKPPPDNKELLPADQVVGILGDKVQDLAGEDMGLVVDVVVDVSGKPRALVIDFGGFLGVGSRKIAIDWRLVHFRPENHDAPVLLRLGRAEVETAPEFVPGVEPLRMLGPMPSAPDSPNAGP